MVDEIVREEIKSKGPITFRRFMELCLYHPEHGYYSKGPAIGKEGDFFTSSSVGEIFGRTLAHALKEMLDVVGGDVLVEMGAGTGDLAKDVLKEFTDRGWPVRYVIVERSPSLRELQREKLEGIPVEWVSRICELEPVCGVFFSNELVDAFPVHLVEKRDGRLWEVYVDVNEDGSFVEVLGEPSTEEIDFFFELQEVELPDGFRTEVNLDIFRWLEDVARALERGFLVTIDYGYNSYDFYHPSRNRGTLMCYYRHTSCEDPFVRLGKQDMTSHVNFSAIARYGERLGFDVVGFTNQVNFLIDAGILDLVRDQRELLQVKTLIMPGSGMGERFKVLVQGRGVSKNVNLRCLRNAPKRRSFVL